VGCVVQFLEVGRVSSIQVNHKPVEKALKGQDVCIKIDPVPGEAPKMYGRHFEHTDLLFSKVHARRILSFNDIHRVSNFKSYVAILTLAAFYVHICFCSLA